MPRENGINWRNQQYYIKPDFGNVWNFVPVGGRVGICHTWDSQIPRYLQRVPTRLSQSVGEKRCNPKTWFWKQTFHLSDCESVLSPTIQTPCLDHVDKRPKLQLDEALRLCILRTSWFQRQKNSQSEPADGHNQKGTPFSGSLYIV